MLTLGCCGLVQQMAPGSLENVLGAGVKWMDTLASEGLAKRRTRNTSGCLAVERFQ